MKLDTAQLLSDQEKVCEEAVRSIMLGIELGDKIPPIEIVRFKDVIACFPEVAGNADNFREAYIVYNGNNRAKAHDILRLPVETAIITRKLNEWVPYGELTSIEGLRVISNPCLFESKKSRAFYRDLLEEKK